MGIVRVTTSPNTSVAPIIQMKFNPLLTDAEKEAVCLVFGNENAVIGISDIKKNAKKYLNTVKEEIGLLEQEIKEEKERAKRAVLRSLVWIRFINHFFNID